MFYVLYRLEIAQRNFTDIVVFLENECFAKIRKKLNAWVKGCRKNPRILDEHVRAIHIYNETLPAMHKQIQYMEYNLIFQRSTCDKAGGNR